MADLLSATRSQSLLVLALAFFTRALAESGSSIVQTFNYIDTISGYNELSTCAEQVLSTVVRAEYSGCGDSYAITSYTCFCTDSSSYMSAVISRDVMSSCPVSVASLQASSALGIFAAYCELGVSAGLTTQTAAGAASPTATGESSSASPADTIAPATATVTISSTPTNANSASTSSASSSSNTLAIVVGVVVSFFGCMVVLAAWIFWRKHKRRVEKPQVWPDAVNETNNEPRGWSRKEAPSYEYRREVPATERPVEVFTNEHPTEVPAHTNPVELPAGAFRHGQNQVMSGNQFYEGVFTKQSL